MSFNIRPSQVAVINCLKEHGPVTIREIAQHTGMTRASVEKAIFQIRQYATLEKQRVGTGRSFLQVAYRWSE